MSMESKYINNHKGLDIDSTHIYTSKFDYSPFQDLNMHKHGGFLTRGINYKNENIKLPYDLVPKELRDKNEISLHYGKFYVNPKY